MYTVAPSRIAILLINPVFLIPKMFKTLEFRRQIFHIMLGVVLIKLLKDNIINKEIIFLSLLFGGVLIYFYKKNYHVPLVYRILHLFEREKHLIEFPGRGVFFYLLGVFLVLLLFPQEIAIASVAILAFGDAVTNIIGRNFGNVRILFKPKKSVEGTLGGIIAGMCGAIFFTSLHPIALLVASSLAMLAEIPHFKIFNFPLDDNLIIPLTAGTTLSFIYFILV